MKLTVEVSRHDSGWTWIQFYAGEGRTGLPLHSIVWAPAVGADPLSAIYYEARLVNDHAEFRRYFNDPVDAGTEIGLFLEWAAKTFPQLAKGIEDVRESMPDDLFGGGK